LRTGASLPGFTYDSTEDAVTYSHNISFSAGTPVTVTVPVASAEQLSDELLGTLDRLRFGTAIDPTLALHELVEGTMLVQMLRPTKPHFRWFTDGFANVIAIELSRRHIGEQDAVSYRDGFDIEPYLDIKREVNLRFWLPADIEIPTPLDEEERLRKARYCFATHEARQLVEQHGLDLVRRILAEPTDDLVQAVSAAAGEDVAERLAQYQPAEPVQALGELYGRRFSVAMEDGNDEAALRAILRLNELSGGRNVQHNAIASHLLHRMGDARAARAVLEQQRGIFAKREQPDGTKALNHAFVIFALRLNQHEPAYDVAEQILADSPDDLAALTIRLHRLIGEGQAKEAELVAERIIDLSPGRDHPACRVAQAFLDRVERMDADRVSD
jgi:hypothetical protein